MNNILFISFYRRKVGSWVATITTKKDGLAPPIFAALLEWLTQVHFVVMGKLNCRLHQEQTTISEDIVLR